MMVFSMSLLCLAPLKWLCFPWNCHARIFVLFVCCLECFDWRICPFRCRDLIQRSHLAIWEEGLGWTVHLGRINWYWPGDTPCWFPFSDIVSFVYRVSTDLGSHLFRWCRSLTTLCLSLHFAWLATLPSVLCWICATLFLSVRIDRPKCPLSHARRFLLPCVCFLRGGRPHYSENKNKPIFGLSLQREEKPKESRKTPSTHRGYEREKDQAPNSSEGRSNQNVGNWKENWT